MINKSFLIAGLLSLPLQYNDTVEYAGPYVLDRCVLIPGVNLTDISTRCSAGISTNILNYLVQELSQLESADLCTWLADVFNPYISSTIVCDVVFANNAEHWEVIELSINRRVLEIESGVVFDTQGVAEYPYRPMTVQRLWRALED